MKGKSVKTSKPVKQEEERKKIMKPVNLKKKKFFLQFIFDRIQKYQVK